MNDWRWVFWGTVLGLTPLLLLDIAVVAMPFGGIAVEAQRWSPPRRARDRVDSDQPGLRDHPAPRLRYKFVLGRGLQYLLARNALRLLLSLPVAGLAYGMIVHRDQPIGQLLWTNSAYLYLICAAILSLRFRTQLTHWVDRRFFRET